MGARPDRVQKARLAGDTDYLSAAGKKGNLVRRRNTQANKLFDERLREQNEADEITRREQAGEDVLPLDLYE